MKGCVKINLFNRNYITILIIATCVNLQNQVINPIITQYSQSLGVSINFASYIFAFFAVGSLCSRPICSKSLSAKSSKKIVIYSSILMSLCCLLYGFIAVDFYIYLRFFHGACFAFCTTALMAWVSNFIPTEHISKGMSIFGLGQVLSVGIGPFIALFISYRSDYKNLFIFASSLSFCAFILSFFAKKIPASHKSSKALYFKIKNTALLALILFLVNGIEAAFILIYARSINIQNTWVYFIISASFMLIARIFFGGLCDKKNLKEVLVPCFSLLFCWGILLIFAKKIAFLFFIAAAFKGFAHALTQASLQAQSVKNVPKNETASACATFYMACDLGIILAPTLTSFLNGNFVLIYLLASSASLFAVFFSISKAR